jgi:hypothetical protein
MMRVHHMVSDLERDALDLALDLQLLDLIDGFGDGVLLNRGRSDAGPPGGSCL